MLRGAYSTFSCVPVSRSSCKLTMVEVTALAIIDLKQGITHEVNRHTKTNIINTGVRSFNRNGCHPVPESHENQSDSGAWSALRESLRNICTAR